MLTGKVILRAVCGHLLVVAALHAVIMSEIYNSLILMDNDKESNCPSDLFCLEDNLDLLEICDLLDGTIAGEVSAEDLDGNAAIRDMVEKRKTYKNNLSSSRTGNLWFLYIEVVEILCKFITAERTGNFSLHLQAVKDMLPFFAASRHSLYAQSAYIYLQTMSNLHEIHPYVYAKFQEGYHDVRRSDRLWAGLSTDLAIEQVLMRSLETTGGLTWERGMTELQRTVWLLSTPGCAEVNRAMQEVANVTWRTAQRNFTSTPSKRFQRPPKDLTVCDTKKPIQQSKGTYMSIDTGEIAIATVNVDQAKKIRSDIVTIRKKTWQ